jgi:nucleoid DNA-binding protein
MNKSELVEGIAKRAGLSHANARASLDATLQAITESLKAGDPVVITGFGTFDISDRPERTGRNPRTGEAVRIRAARVPRFKPGKNLRDNLQ